MNKSIQDKRQNHKTNVAVLSRINNRHSIHGEVARSLQSVRRRDGEPLSDRLTYAESLAWSLLCAADNNALVENEMMTLMSAFPEAETKQDSFPTPVGVDIGLLGPHHREAALERLHWLVGRIVADTMPDVAKAKALLGYWARIKPLERKQLIVGMIQIAIPGITLGKWDDKERMMIIIRRDCLEELAVGTRFARNPQMVFEAGMKVLEEALYQAAGDTRQLEPELGNWFFGERSLLCVSADSHSLHTIENELTAIGVAHSAFKDETRNPMVLAISPAVNHLYACSRWDVTPLESPP